MKNRKQSLLRPTPIAAKRPRRPSRTSPRVATLAGKTLSDEHASKKAKTLAASALAQSAFAKPTADKSALRKPVRPNRKSRAA